jgi:hypothetical protein
MAHEMSMSLGPFCLLIIGTISPSLMFCSCPIIVPVIPAPIVQLLDIVSSCFQLSKQLPVAVVGGGDAGMEQHGGICSHPCHLLRSPPHPCVPLLLSCHLDVIIVMALPLLLFVGHGACIVVLVVLMGVFSLLLSSYPMSRGSWQWWGWFLGCQSSSSSSPIVLIPKEFC